jgi:hypothetical protein
MENIENKEREKNKLLPSYYYIEGKSIVFTEQYHLDRGHCCGSVNGCRHCPYEPKGIKGNSCLIKK